MTATETLICPDCGAAMHLRSTNKWMKGGVPRKWYGCERWPECNGSIGAHPDGRPLGVPINVAGKQVRIKTHDAFDRLWKRDLGGWMRRKDAYRLMRQLMDMNEQEAHIGNFGVDECERLMSRLAEYLAER